MNLFNYIPPCFFNCLASGSNQKIYADCIQRIYEEYEREISYRIPRNRIRDALAMYFYDTHVKISEDDSSGDSTPQDMANMVIRKFMTKDIGWLTEEVDDATYEKQIVMTEHGIALAEFLNQLQKPEKEEFSSYIYNIYNTLENKEQWQNNPYIGMIKNINKNSRSLSKSLKKLSTFIRKIIEKMIQEETLESLTENIMAYCEGDFIREYSRLTKQQNIHIYRSTIVSKMTDFMLDEEFLNQSAEECMKEESLDYTIAYNQVWEMIEATKRFLMEDYDQIMKEIRHKIQVYLHIAIGRARFILNKQNDTKGSVEKVIKYLLQDLDNLDMKDEVPEEINSLFIMDRHEFIDEGSIRFPNKPKAIKITIESDYEELTEEAKQAARLSQLKEAYNPYSKNIMKQYLENQMGDAKEVNSDEFPLVSKEDLLINLSALAYAGENGFRIELQEGYLESNSMLLRRFKVVKEEKNEY